MLLYNYEKTELALSEFIQALEEHSVQNNSHLTPNCAVRNA